MATDIGDFFSCTGILLAAGRGLRFDPQGGSNKLLQPVGDGNPVAFSKTYLPQLLQLGGDECIYRDIDRMEGIKSAGQFKQTSLNRNA